MEEEEEEEEEGEKRRKEETKVVVPTIMRLSWYSCAVLCVVCVFIYVECM